MLAQAIAELLALDRALFLWINGGTYPAWLDDVMRTLTSAWFGRGLFALFALLLAKGRGARGLLVVLGLALTIAASDQLSAHVLKPIIGRERPVQAHLDVQLLVRNSRTYAFPSAHAANTFAGATYCARFAPGLALPLFALAAIVSFSRIYVGVHYPLDLVGGALLGFLCAIAVLRLMAARGLVPPAHRREPRRALPDRDPGEPPVGESLSAEGSRNAEGLDEPAGRV
jgi:undecaprenyl-diphosphatase